jgi:hypothetical protein
LLEQCTQETIVLQGSHVGIRKNSAGIFSDASAKGTVKAMRFVYWMPWIKDFCIQKCLWGCFAARRDTRPLLQEVRDPL